MFYSYIMAYNLLNIEYLSVISTIGFLGSSIYRATLNYLDFLVFVVSTENWFIMVH